MDNYGDARPEAALGETVTGFGDQGRRQARSASRPLDREMNNGRTREDVASVPTRTFLSDAPRGRTDIAQADPSSRRVQSKASKRGMSLPRLAFRKSTASSSASSQSVPTPVIPSHDRRGSPNHHVKESIDTQQTSASSLYPLSTPTDLDPPDSPHSFLELDDTRASLDAEAHAFDADDISYRLRLLVNNNYFLPPAHAKPNLSNLAPASKAPKPARPGTPKFLDLFRKPRSAVTSPESTPVLEITGPILRNTAESIAADGYLQRPVAPPTIAHSNVNLAARRPSCDLTPRVVVVRETLGDLYSAAKEAEKELKAKAEPPSRGAARVPVEFIDPTDIVDAAPLPADYTLALQTSQVHGLGIQDSLGADVLAEQLPPPGTPFWSSDTEDHTWRKALLHEAVSLSLNNTAESSFGGSLTSAPNSPTPPTPAPARPRQDRGRAATIGQRIADLRLLVPDDIIDASPVHSPARRRPNTSPGRMAAGPTRSHQARSEAPVLTTALSPPPPRKTPANPLSSISHTDLPSSSAGYDSFVTAQDGSLFGSVGARPAVVRRSVSSPMLASASYDAGPSLTAFTGAACMTPPPSRSLRTSASVMLSDPHGVTTVPEEPRSGSVRDSMWSSVRDSHDFSRPSMSREAGSTSVGASHGRPSFDNRAASPSASAFRDAFDYPASTEDRRSPSPFAQQSFGMTMASRVSRFSYASTHASGSGSHLPSMPPRSTNMSPPPPRPSSTFLPVQLVPPPRKGARASVARPEQVPPRTLVSPPSKDSLASSASSFSTTSAPGGTSFYSVSVTASVPQIVAPEPTTPPFPTTESDSPPARRPIQTRHSSDARLPALSTLVIPAPESHGRTPSIRSAPEVTSPTAFFDQIQDSMNAFDEESSSDEEEQDVTAVELSVYADARTHASASRPSFQPASPRPSIMSLTAPASPRPSFMRLGNHSTPSFSGSAHGPQKRGIENVPQRQKYFTEKKHGGASALYSQPTATIGSSVFLEMDEELPPPSRPRSPASSRGQADARSVRSVASGDSARRTEESVRLESVFTQHMQAEREAIRRITTAVANVRR